MISYSTVMRIFAARVRAAIERTRIESALREANEKLTQSEERFRDLFDEAPVAYVHQGTDTRIIRASRTALKILGTTAEEITGILGT